MTSTFGRQLSTARIAELDRCDLLADIDREAEARLCDLPVDRRV